MLIKLSYGSRNQGNGGLLFFFLILSFLEQFELAIYIKLHFPASLFFSFLLFCFLFFKSLLLSFILYHLPSPILIVLLGLGGHSGVCPS